MVKIWSVLSACLLSTNLLAAEANPLIGEFSARQLAAWDSKSFKGATQYQLVQDGQRWVLSAKSQAAASGLTRKIKVDLTQTPFLNWSWRIDQPLPALNEQTKAGDDYAARLYVIVDGGLLVWNSKAVNYVWSGSSARGATWGNAYLPKNAQMLAVRGKQDKTGVWITEKRNVRADFQKLYGVDIQTIDGVALMTDSDNSKSEAAAKYGDIFFSAR
ncbi:DUF3047 domain-containing protein [Thiothrix eikelboomii]|uniref:DUF3047 domain-containing protein n=1 Tax=Thiothrix eikelboomii TaxID=92487 RepID=UPI003BB05BB5